METPVAFDGAAMMAALDEERSRLGQDLNALADKLYEQSSDLNAELGDHRMCPGALGRTFRRGTMSCQYALIILRWLDRPPEDFLIGERANVGSTRLPEVGPDRRLRWDLAQLHATLDGRRQQRGLTWAALAEEIRCTPSRLTNLRTARLADMDLTMRVTQYLQRPAAEFIRPERW